ncbi:MAG: hypothetical protein JWR38_592 [Mucilaginibacter sp.]|nr:hypothetical protein [Mucilaginibacter sp.]
MLANSLNVSIIIVNYNTTDLTIKCIESIKRFTVKNSYEVILIDNASQDRSILKVPEIFPEIKFIANDTNVGFGRANNIGIKMALGKYVFLLNTDAFLLSDAIFSFWTFMEGKENANIACCGGALVDENKETVVSYGNFPSVLEAFSSIGFFVLYKKYYKRHIHSGVLNYSEEAREVDFICGADMFIRRSVLDKVGLFDPDFFLYFEETELSFRIFKAGYKSFIIPNVNIIHLGGGSQKDNGGINLKQVELFSKSRNIYFEKCYGKKTVMPVKILYTIRALIYGLSTWNKQYTRVAAIILQS